MSASTATSRQLEANRQNARKSTGPTSADGKRRVSLNALRHGLYAKDLVLPGEDRGAFDALARLMLRRLNPRDVLELQIVERIISACWRLKRVQAAEATLYDEWEADLWMSQYTDSQDEEAAEPHPPPIVMAKLLQDTDDPVLERLHRYERRLEGTLHRCLRQLRQLRQENRADPEPPTELTQILLDEQDAAHGPEVDVTDDENETCGTKPNRRQPMNQTADAPPATGVGTTVEQPPGPTIIAA